MLGSGTWSDGDSLRSCLMGLPPEWEIQNVRNSPEGSEVDEELQAEWPALGWGNKEACESLLQI